MDSDELICRYLHGVASEEEVRELDRRLRSDQALQEDFLVQSELDANLRQEAQLGSRDDVQQASSDESADHWQQNHRGRRMTVRILLAVATVALIAVVTQAFLLPGSPQEIITVTSVSGPIAWTGDGGHVTNAIAVGEKLPGGTLELLSPDASVEFAFKDRSALTLAGLSAMTISNDSLNAGSEMQKKLYLRHGRLSARVQRQPRGRPLIVSTNTAELTVLGTKFNVETSPESTRLTVKEGSVRLKRLPDGKEVDVPAQQCVFASLENQNALPLQSLNSPVNRWQSELRQDVVMGKWTSRLWGIGVKLKKAVASGKMSEQEALKVYKQTAHLNDSAGSVWTVSSPVGALLVLSVGRSQDHPVHLLATSSILVRGRAFSRTPVKIGLNVEFPDGGFAGKYSTTIPASQFAVGEEFEMELPLNKFRDDRKTDVSPVGLELTDWWLVAESSSGKFEITSVELANAPLRDKP